MLTARADDLADRIGDLARRRRMRGNVDRFRTRAQQLEGPAQRLQQLALALALFRARGLAVPPATDRLDTLREQLRRLREAFADDRMSVVQPDGDLRFTFWQPLGQMPDQIEAALRDAWMRYISAQLPARQDDLLTVMERVPGFGTQVAGIRALYADAATRVATLPVNSAAFDAVADVGAALQRGWSALGGEGLPAEVIAFLRAATTGGASREQFTPAVEAWLDEQQLGQHVRISLSGAPR